MILVCMSIFKAQSFPTKCSSPAMPFLYSSQRLFYQFLWTIQQSSHTTSISALETSHLLSSLPPKLPLFSFHNAVSQLLSWPTNRQPGSTPPMRSLHAADQSQYIANTSSLISRLHPVTAQPLFLTQSDDENTHPPLSGCRSPIILFLPRCRSPARHTDAHHV